ncbi:MAG TPA: hypothetical protein VKZ18_10640 [Polyangia bacterium]|nr:hypothetical protein [Polyangia bacterium]
MASFCLSSAAITRPAGAGAAGDSRAEARAETRRLVAGIQQIERIRAKTPPGGLDGNCVEAKLAEARAGLQIAGGELARVDGGEETAYALHRLHLLGDRSDELVRAARVCATDEQSTIDTTQVEVEISPNVPGGDPTRPPSSFQRVDRPPEQ